MYYVGVQAQKDIKQLIRNGLEFKPFTESDYADKRAWDAWWDSQVGLNKRNKDQNKIVNRSIKQNVNGTLASTINTISGVIKNCTFAETENTGKDVFVTVTSEEKESHFKMDMPQKDEDETTTKDVYWVFKTGKIDGNVFCAFLAASFTNDKSGEQWLRQNEVLDSVRTTAQLTVAAQQLLKEQTAAKAAKAK
jgi:hypothetical protein